MKLILRIIIFILIGFALFSLLCISNPRYTMDDLYLVSGYCSDVHFDFISSKAGSQRVYIVMDDGEAYYIYDYLWKRLDEEQRDMKGKEISFYASDKGKHWVFDHLFVGFGSDKDDCLDSVKSINKSHASTKVMLLSMYSIVLFCVYLAPEILYQMEQRDKASKKKNQKNKKNRAQ